LTGKKATCVAFVWNRSDIQAVIALFPSNTQNGLPKIILRNHLGVMNLILKKGVKMRFIRKCIGSDIPDLDTFFEPSFEAQLKRNIFLLTQVIWRSFL